MASMETRFVRYPAELPTSLSFVSRKALKKSTACIQALAACPRLLLPETPQMRMQENPSKSSRRKPLCKQGDTALGYWPNKSCRKTYSDFVWLGLILVLSMI
ncbi:uncharacterized protein HMPREF1120_05873 [Exophiala dermatitidis NIH/UT8656]|uniref:Uncharacterized protein n=1 Tax=Exophiala dermatitidis (strain ATCC 34100 / CBS 525.76 / NIH/UT8656) TaxID=858893 RepID=H6C223_EXODN|nr:uncharacterized protein HMPREF1120_05873 [Exophiala dermatitidis NIH/UT8656]EHY57849.1 hypothetical protein HMPREF1120_05873 [Exophiala dermatitidis NIH/UT8656]